ncbi:hypothetical protein R1sor_008951 [Riccia sorocarpa]|uniref:Uncharacterized protein n=1 Tax=Riccia sorocarpa TaxID=122646 RepID=A0ABD3H766_9MARC
MASGDAGSGLERFRVLTSSRGNLEGKENGGEGIPPFAKVLLMLESLGESVKEVKSSVASLSLVASDIRRDVRLLFAKTDDLSKLRGIIGDLDCIKTEVKEIRGDRQAMDRLNSGVQDVRLELEQLREKVEVVASTTSQSTGDVRLLQETLQNCQQRLETSADDYIGQLKTLEQGVDSRLTQCVQTTEAYAHELTALRHSVDQGKCAGTSVNAPALDINQLTETIEARMHSYADVARSAQTEAIQEHEREKTARTARRLNLRIVGIEEQDGEEPKTTVMEFFRNSLEVANPKVESVIRIGSKDRGPYGPVWIMGDLNGQTGETQSREVRLDGDLTRGGMEDNTWARQSDNKGRNGFSDALLELVNAGGLTIMNGTPPFSSTRDGWMDGLF